MSSILGIHNRSTMDIDFCLKRMGIDEESVLIAMREIGSIDIGDGVSFFISKAEQIRKDDAYGGYQIKVLGKFENLKYEFCVDVATGDPIVPSEREYKYKNMLTGEVLEIKTYSLESVIAEKLQTALMRQTLNSRNKDLYDLYVLRKTQFENVDIATLRKAFKLTCEYRNVRYGKNDSLEIIKGIENNIQFRLRWQTYEKKTRYASGLSLEEAIRAVKEWLIDIFE